MMAVNVPDLISSHQPEGGQDTEDLKGNLVLVFDIHIKKKYGVQKQNVSNLKVDRSNPARLRDLTEHLETQLLLPGGHGRRLLLQAICAGPLSTASDRSITPRVVPLVCEQLWSTMLRHYPHSRLKILVDRHRSLAVTHKKTCREWLFGREVKLLDINTYLPTKNLTSHNIIDLCHAIFERRFKIKHSLRKGVWMHLVGVFPPELKSRERREEYVEQLRMVYDSLKGKWKGEQGSSQVQQLVEAVHRDAVRTDPTHPFYTRGHTATESLTPDSISNLHEESNIQKLVNIITIYILEHGDVSYTQGMTDLLSPFLYVMKRESDAYICFAAMVERIKSHFNTWCEGTLHKIERLRHICEVLDPELFRFLTVKIEEDAFALFFGMVLIECRREFSFDDSFHLFEATWAGVTCMKDSLHQYPSRSRSEWAHFMTYESKEVIQQVFGETQSPYSAQPLPRSYSDTITSTGGNRLSFSRNASLLSQGSLNSLTHQYQPGLSTVDASMDQEPSPALSINRSDGQGSHLVHSSGIQQHAPNMITVDIEGDSPDTPHEFRPRSYTDPNLKLSAKQNESFSRRCVSGSPSNGIEDSPGAASNLANAHPFSHSHSESELYDSFSNNKLPESVLPLKIPTELTDLSSVSSETISTNGNSQKSVANQNPGRGNDRSRGRRSTSTNQASSRETSKTPLVSHSAYSSLSSPEPEFSIPANFVTNDTNHVNETAPSSANGTIVYAKQTTGPISISPSSVYQTANEESSAGQSSSSQSSARKGSRRSRRVVKKGERITTESIPDEYHLGDDQQEDSNQSTPSRHLHTGNNSPFRYRSPRITDDDGQSNENNEHQKSRITPVAFFDAIDNIASSVPGTTDNSGIFSVASGAQFDDSDESDDDPFLSAGRLQRQMRSNSDVSMLMSQLVSTEEATPRVTREKSLKIPVSDCFPLFVCMSILAQHRTQIMQSTTDFVGLSVILNAQAGQQDVDKTLYIARDLYRIYRGYQAACIGDDPSALNTWLDDDRPKSNVIENRHTGNHHVESGSIQEQNRRNSRNSVASDSVFDTV